MSHYYPRHVSGLDMPILRRNNYTNTAFGILALLSGCTLHRLRADCSPLLKLVEEIILSHYLLHLVGLAFNLLLFHASVNAKI